MTNKEYFRSRYTFSKRRDVVWKSIAKRLQKYIRKNSAVLDLGAGYCNFINNIKAKEKHALDIFDIRKYANRDVIVHISSSSKIKDIKSEYFDVIFASNFFEHLKKKEIYSSLEEVKRILKKNGKLIIIQPNFKYCYKTYFDDYTHKTIFTDTSMCNILETFSFKIEKNIPKFLPFSLKLKLPKIKFLIDLYLLLPVKPFAKQMLIIAKKL